MTRGDRHTADAIAAQLADAHRRAIARGAAAGSGLGAWETLAALAAAAPAADRAALAELVERAGRARGASAATCLVGGAALIEPTQARARLRAALFAATDWADRGALVAALPAAEQGEHLPRLLDAALALPDDAARWAACDELLIGLDRAATDAWTRWFAAASEARHGRASDDPYRWLGVPLTAAQRDARIAAEQARWGASFEAWRLGADAQALPAAERAAGFDRALDAFAALIATPIDPGNDEGPCWAIAPDLSLPQVRRALAILAQMNARDWCYQLAGSKAALLTRLAALGELDEALAVLRSIDPDGEFAATWRATAWGGLIAGQLAHAPALTVAAALRDAAAEDPVSLGPPEGRQRALAELHYRAAQLRPLAHAAAIAAGCIDEVVALRRRDPRLGRIALEDCIGAWGPIAPLDRWLALIADEPAGADRVELLETLLVEQPAAAPALIAELARTPAPYPAATLRLLLEQPTAVPPAALLPTWDAWLAAADSPGFARTIIDGRDAFAAAVAHLGGPAAATRACHALAVLGDAG